MSNRLLELCFWYEEIEENSNYMGFAVPANMSFMLVDPYMVNMEDLKNLRPGSIIRMRRPAWGRGCVGEHLKVFTL